MAQTLVKSQRRCIPRTKSHDVQQLAPAGLSATSMYDDLEADLVL